MRHLTSTLRAIPLCAALGLSAPLCAQTWDGPVDEQGNRHGAWTETLDDGTVRREVTYRHGVEHGPDVGYHASGRVYWRQSYRDGAIHGDHVTYFDDEDSTVQLTGKFEDGSKTGEWIENHIDGKPKEILTFFRGVKNGPAKSFHFSGGISVETTYRAGELDGAFVSKFDNGDNSTQWEGAHQMGQRFGEWTERYNNGRLKSVINYHAGLKHGRAIFFFSDERVSGRTNYSRDQLHGPYVEYYDTFEEIKRVEGGHRDGQRFGLWKQCSPTGRLVSEENYVDGLKNGPAAYYSAFDSTLEYETVFKNDEHHGTFTSYHNPELLSDYDLITHLFGDDLPDGRWEPSNEYVGEGNERTLVKKWNVLDRETGEILDSFTMEKEATKGPVNQTGEHRNGKRVGEWKSYFSSGRLMTVSNWKNGLEHGASTSYMVYESLGTIDFVFGTGEVRVSTSKEYVDGKLHGIAEGFYNNADYTLRYRHLYADGQSVGEWTDWHENGEVKLQGSWDDGYKSGEWKEFNEEGELIKTTTYDAGQVVSETSP